MKKKDILTYYHPVLRRKAKEVSAEEETGVLIKKMKKVLKKEEGVGLAAPQIGAAKRVVIVNTADEQMVAFLNPVIKEKSKETTVVKEGCLSVRGVWINVERSRKVTAEFLTEEGKKMEIEAEGMMATILQHEIDHLEGKLIIDKVNFLQKIKILASYYFQKYVRAR